MRGVKQCQGSTGRMRTHRYSTEFKVTAIKLANAPGIAHKRPGFEVFKVVSHLSPLSSAFAPSGAGAPADAGGPAGYRWRSFAAVLPRIFV